MMRLLGAGLLAMAGMMAGISKREREKETVKALEDMDRALGTVAAEIEFRERPLGEIFSALAESGPERLREFYVLAGIGDTLGESWKAAAEKLFPNEEAAILSGLSAVLGRYEGPRQAAEIQAVRLELREIAQLRRRLMEEKAKNYPALGLCAGAVAGIILI